MTHAQTGRPARTGAAGTPNRIDLGVVLNSTPSGCRWCGVDERDHMQRWKAPVGWHKWTQPTSDQIKTRMQQRAARRNP